MRPYLAIVALGLSALLIACGGEDGDDGSASDGAPLTEAEYPVALAPVARQIETLGESLPDVSAFGEPEFADALEAKADDAADAAGALEALGPPEVLASEHDRLVETMLAVEGGFRDAATASLGEDVGATDGALGVASSNLDTAAAIADEMESESTAP